MASFAGFAPVSNPAISIAVVIDTPTVGTRYGGTTSAPVFAEVAQQVLEYLGVPHDQPLKPKKELTQIATKDLADDNISDDRADLNQMYADINDLPADDPLRNPTETASTTAASPVPATAGKTSAAKSSNLIALLPAKVVAAFHSGAAVASSTPTAAVQTEPKIVPAVQERGNAGVVVDAGHRVEVPSFEGLSLRNVVEKANGLGLRVQPTGGGLAREQAPVAGTSVPVGTEVVVRFAR